MNTLNLINFSIVVPRGVKIREMPMTTAEFLKCNYAANPAAQEAKRVKRAQEHQARLAQLREAVE